MKLLVLLAVLGAVSAQYKFYTGVTPYVSNYAPYTHPLTYAAHPLTYTAHPVTYTGYPYVHGLPLSFKPAEKAAEEAKPAVESRSKRSADEDQETDAATYLTTYAANSYHPLAYTTGYPYTYTAPTVYSAGYTPLAYHGCAFGVHNCNVYPGYTAPVVHSLKKRDTSAAEEDQKPEDATLYTTYASHPLTYAGYPFSAYSAAYQAPVVYNAASPAVTYPGFNYGYPYAYRTFY